MKPVCAHCALYGEEAKVVSKPFVGNMAAHVTHSTLHPLCLLTRRQWARRQQTGINPSDSGEKRRGFLLPPPPQPLGTSLWASLRSIGATRKRRGWYAVNMETGISSVSARRKQAYASYGIRNQLNSHENSSANVWFISAWYMESVHMEQFDRKPNKTFTRPPKSHSELEKGIKKQFLAKDMWARPYRIWMQPERIWRSAKSGFSRVVLILPAVWR